jgi:hypothetical protein
MEFGLTKCWTLTTGRGNVKAEGFQTQQGDIIEKNENDTYRYLGILKTKWLSSPLTGVEWSRGFQEVKVTGLHDNGTGWW